MMIRGWCRVAFLLWIASTSIERIGDLEEEKRKEEGRVEREREEPGKGDERSQMILFITVSVTNLLFIAFEFGLIS